MMTLKRQHLFLILVGIGSFIFATIGTYNGLTRPYPGHNDFMSRWEGARSYWVDGLNPYGDEASLNIQERIYGRAVVDDEDPGYFAYPFYTAFMVWPLVYVDYAWASAIWMVLLETVLLAALFLQLDVFQWKPRPLFLGALVLWSLLSYYPSRGLLLGQPGHLVYFLEVLTLWALLKGHDRLAGVALALSTIKPQMGYLVVPFLLLWGLRDRRFSFVGWFVGVFGVLMAASFLLVPSWLSDWMGQVSIYSSYTALGSPVWIVVQYYLGLGSAANTLVDVLFYGFMLWTWYTLLIQGKRERFFWTVMVTLTVTHLVAPRTATPHYVVFMIPLLFYLRELTKPKYRRGRMWAWLLLIALFVIPWIHFLTTVKDEFEHPTLYLPVPFGVFLLLVVTRKLWWNDPVTRPMNVKEAAS